MPLKEIVSIRDEGIFVVPNALLYVYNFKKGDLILCEFKKHLDKNKNLIHEINEEGIGKIFHSSDYPDYSDSKYYFKERIITRKYGLRANEYVEIVFKEIRRKVGLLKTVAIPISQKE